MKKLVYLISPEKIDKSFYKKLEKVLSYGNVGFFQLRLKKSQKKTILSVAKKIQKITKKQKVKFIINDYCDLVLKIGADGCHIGQSDMSIEGAKRIIKNKLLGVTCHNSKKLAYNAKIKNVSYIAFGSFYQSKLKPKATKANLKIINWAKKNIKKPIVAIGGINNLNYKKLINSGANYIAISSFIWDNPQLKPEDAIKIFKK